MVLLIFNSLTLIQMRNGFHLMEWVCFMKDGCIWDHLQLLMVMAEDFLLVK